MDSLKFVTSNPHKYKEIQAKLSSIGINLDRVNLSYGEIQADTIKEVAANSLTQLSPLLEGDFLLEDAGLEIDSLDGFPGPYSSYVFRSIGWRGILKLMEGIENRKARFISVIGLKLATNYYFFEGYSEGSISLIGRGDQGFGFDPVFIPKEYESTFGELDLSVKNQLSHRAKSVEKLLSFFETLE